MSQMFYDSCDICNYWRVYVLTRVATWVVDRACVRIRTRVDFKMEAVLFFIDGSKMEMTRPVYISDQTFLSVING